MKKYLFILCYFTSIEAYSQDKQFIAQWMVHVSWFLPAEQVSRTERTEYTQKLLEHCQKLAKQRRNIKQERKFLQKVFYQTHKKFKLAYATNSSVAQAVLVGKFDCVSGTALFALVLDYLGYTYEIHETTSHAYLKVKTLQGIVLLETTNVTQGFVKFANEIREIEQTYSPLLPKHTNRIITLKELAGLQFYNQALFAMQTENFATGNALLHKAKMLYHRSERVERLLYLAEKR